jgi:hypothetical protein
MWRIFAQEYLMDEQPGERRPDWPEEVAAHIVSASLYVDRRVRSESDQADTERAAAIEAALRGRNVDARVVSTVGAVGSTVGPDGEPVTPGTAVAEWAADTFAVYAECRVAGEPEPTWGIGFGADVVAAAEAAVRSAAARAARSARAARRACAEQVAEQVVERVA